MELKTKADVLSDVMDEIFNRKQAVPDKTDLVYLGAALTARGKTHCT